MGRGLEEQVYRFIDREGNILALRPEFTSLVAKTAVTRLAASPKPIRLYLFGEVLRFEKPKGGRQIGARNKTGIENFRRRKAGRMSYPIDRRWSVCHCSGWEFPNFKSIWQWDFFGGIVDRIELPEDQIAKSKLVLNLKDQPGLEALLQSLPLEERRKTFCAPFPT